MHLYCSLPCSFMLWGGERHGATWAKDSTKLLILCNCQVYQRGNSLREVQELGLRPPSQEVAEPGLHSSPGLEDSKTWALYCAPTGGQVTLQTCPGSCYVLERPSQPPGTAPRQSGLGLEQPVNTPLAQSLGLLSPLGMGETPWGHLPDKGTTFLGPMGPPRPSARTHILL